MQSADQSADQKEECTQLCKSLPSCRAQLVQAGASRQGGFCFTAGLAKYLKDWSLLGKLKCFKTGQIWIQKSTKQGMRRHAGAEPAGGRSPAGGGLARATAPSSPADRDCSCILHQHRVCPLITGNQHTNDSFRMIADTFYYF